jgi:hypothetical protein
MKSLAAILLLLLSANAIAQSSSADSACGPAYVAFKVTKDKLQHPTPTPQDGKALVYLYGWGTLALDGKALGAVSQSYSVLEVDPGEHHLCAWAPGGPLKGLPLFSTALHSLNAKSGETYYFDLDTTTRFVLKLNLVDPDEGKHMVGSLPFSTSRPK